jgi:hypothetical protein
MKKTVWISFDLGVSGDYEGMYAWLAEHDAKECGDSMALVKVDDARGGIVPAVRRDIKKSVKLTPRSRMYMVYRNEDDKVKGTWLVGSRKQAPWTGYGKLVGEAVTDEA